MGPDQLRLTPNEREDLVAYIDGELDEAQARVIASKLTQSKTGRREVEILEKTWQLLDNLDRPKASEDFTARTLTSLDQWAARRGDRAGAAMVAWRRAVRVLVGVVASCLVSVAAYALAARAWPHPTARLVEELPLAEHLDEYRDVGSFEFLEKLDKSTEFAQD